MGSMLDAPVNRFTGIETVPIFRPHLALALAVNYPPNVVIPRGTLLAPVAGGSVNDVQTITLSGSLSGGQFTLAGTRDGLPQTTTGIGFNPTAVQVQAALVALGIFGPNLTVTGSTGGPFTVTFNGGLAGTPIPTLVGNVGTLTGGTPAVTIAHTTTGQSGGTFAAYAGGPVAQPTVAPTVAGAGSGSSFGAGTYATSYTLVTALGETTPSPATFTTITAAQNLSVTSITGLAASVTAVNFYVNGVFAKTVAPSSGATGTVSITGASITAGGTPPLVNGANAKATAVQRFDIATDASGNITFGAAATGGFWGETELSAAAWFTGDFATNDLVGLDANAIAGGLKLVSGTISSGIVRL
jgi:hypothetical protein